MLYVSIRSVREKVQGKVQVQGKSTTFFTVRGMSNAGLCSIFDYIALLEECPMLGYVVFSISLRCSCRYEFVQKCCNVTA